MGGHGGAAFEADLRNRVGFGGPDSGTVAQRCGRGKMVGVGCPWTGGAEKRLEGISGCPWGHKVRRLQRSWLLQQMWDRWAGRTSPKPHQFCPRYLLGLSLLSSFAPTLAPDKRYLPRCLCSGNCQG